MQGPLNLEVLIGLRDRLSAPLRGLRGRFERETQAMERVLSSTANLTLVAGQAQQAGAQLLAPFQAAVRQAANFESAVTNVRKVLDGLETPEALERYRQEVLAATEVLPYTKEQIAALDDQAARMGKTLDQLPAFRQATAMQALAFDMPPEQVAQEMGILGNLYKWSDAQAARFADTLSALDNAMITNERQLLGIVNRTQGVAKGFGLADTQTAALAATFASVGLEESRASTAMNALLNNLLTASAGPAKLQGALVELGYSMKDIGAQINAAPQDFLRDFFARIGKLDQVQRAITLTEIFGKEFQDEIGALAGASDLYATAIETINGAEVEGTMARAFALQMDTLNNQVQILNNSLSNLVTESGRELVGLLKDLVAMLKPAVVAVRDWIKAHPVLARNVLLASGALGLLMAGLGGLLGALAGIIGLLAVLRWALGMSGITGALAFAGRAALLLLTPLGWLIATIGAAIYVFTHWEETVAAASRAYERLVAWLGVDPVGAALAHWQQFAGWLSSTFGSALDAASRAYDGLTAAASAAVDAVRDRFAGLLAWLQGLPGQMLTLAGRVGQSLVDGLIAPLEAGWARVRAAAAKLTGGLIGASREEADAHSPSRAMVRLGNDLVRGLELGIQARQRFAQGALAGTLALGAVTAGAQTPTAEPGAAPRPAAASRVEMPITIHISAPPGTDAHALAALVRREVAQATRQATGRIARLYDASDGL